MLLPPSAIKKEEGYQKQQLKLEWNYLFMLHHENQNKAKIFTS